jgi:hypothetical protein
MTLAENAVLTIASIAAFGTLAAVVALATLVWA